MKYRACILLIALVVVRPEFGLGGDMESPVAAKVVGMKPGKPPLVRLLVDVHLRNDEKTPRWVLIPNSLPLAQGGVDKLEQLTTSSGGKEIAIGRFLGTGGRYALRLAPGADVTIHNLEVRWWSSESSKSLAFDVQWADPVILAGEPMVSWFDRDPAIQGAVEVDMEFAKHTHSHRAPADKEVSVELSGAATTSVNLTPP